MDDIIRTLRNDPMQGHPGFIKMFQELSTRYYSPIMAQKVEDFVDNWQMCI